MQPPPNRQVLIYMARVPPASSLQPTKLVKHKHNGAICLPDSKTFFQKWLPRTHPIHPLGLVLLDPKGTLQHTPLIGLYSNVLYRSIGGWGKLQA